MARVYWSVWLESRKTGEKRVQQRRGRAKIRMSGGTRPEIVAFDGASIWETNFFNNVTKLHASDGALHREPSPSERTLLELCRSRVACLR